LADNLWRLTKTVPGAPLPPDRKLAITKMTELFASSFADLDPEPIIAALAADATYVAQHILNDLEGREAIADVRRQNIWRRLRFRSAEDGPRLGLILSG